MMMMQQQAPDMMMMQQQAPDMMMMQQQQRPPIARKKSKSGRRWKGFQNLQVQLAQGFDFIDQNLLPVGAESTVYPVQQQLIVVEATYLLPIGSVAAAPSGPPKDYATMYGYSNDHSKLCESAVELCYLDREAYIRGLSEVLFAPPCTMEQEWLDRNDCWVDWSGKSFSAAEEWKYVTEGKAKEETTPVGLHENGRGGWTLQHYHDHINSTIRENSKHAGGSALELTINETIACRLYTGPGYQKLNNEYLRELGSIDDRDWRFRLAQVPSYTYSATVAHLISAIRKLCRVCEETSAREDSETLLYRSVSGKLPDTFFEPDAQGMITAVDSGMMSTSSERKTPIQYIRNGLGVLFVLHCSTATADTGEHHMGAVLEPLSQYPAETETLFPPLTMLSVLKGEDGNFMIYDIHEDDKLIKEVHVEPSFV
jgi:hypothetical protein